MSNIGNIIFNVRKDHITRLIVSHAFGAIDYKTKCKCGAESEFYSTPRGAVLAGHWADEHMSSEIESRMSLAQRVEQKLADDKEGTL